jgi:RNA 3'-terminal phosphate cyclase (ATP)
VGTLEPGVSELTFQPGRLRPGHYVWEVGTAGSACLVLQTVALPLALAGGPSQVEIVGGTHNPRAPCFEYLSMVWVPWLRHMGAAMELQLISAGFYPKGGGKIVARIPGGLRPEDLKPVRIESRGRLIELTGVSAVANLPFSIAHRQRAVAERRLGQVGVTPQIRIATFESLGPGTVCFLLARFEHSWAAFFSLGARGKSAETVGYEAAEALRKFCSDPNEPAVDPHAADQLIVPLALAREASSFTTSELTEHTRTNAAVVSRLLERTLELRGEPGRAGCVAIR